MTRVVYPSNAWPGLSEPARCPVCDREQCTEHVVAPAAVPRRGLTYVTANALVNEAAPVEIVEGMAWAGCLTVLVSESGTGKTFLLIDLAAAVSSGARWHHRAITQGTVALLSFEGDALGLRLRALRSCAGAHVTDHVNVVRASAPLSPRMGREGEERSIGELEVIAVLQTMAADLTAAGQPPIVLVMIDTVRASLVGSEDNSDPVSGYLRAVRRVLATMPGAAAILAHHAGWQDGEQARKRERGSSAWRGNCDATLYLEAEAYDRTRGEAELTLTTLKVRDGEAPPPLHLVRRRVELDERDRYDRPVTSCVIAADTRTPADREATRALAVDKSDLEILRAVAMNPRVATSQNKIRALVNARKEAVGEAVARLLSRGWMVEPSRQRQPYLVTDDGARALGGLDRELFPVVPSGSH